VNCSTRLLRIFGSLLPIGSFREEYKFIDQLDNPSHPLGLLEPVPRFYLTFYKSVPKKKRQGFDFLGAFLLSRLNRLDHFYHG